MIRMGFLFFSVCFFTLANMQAEVAQHAVFYGTPVQVKNSERLSKHFRSYSIVHLPSETISKALAPSGSRITLQLTGGRQWQLALQPTHLYAPNCQMVLLTPQGRQTQTMPPNCAWHGSINGGGEVRLAIAPGFIYGSLTPVLGEPVFIEPLNYWLTGTPDDLYLVYNLSDAIQTHPLICQTLPHDATHPGANPPNAPPAGDYRQNSGCRMVEIAFAADYLLTQEKGSAEKVAKHLTALLNAVQPSYEVFNIEFALTQLVISTCAACDGWSNTLDAPTLVNAFEQWGNDGGFTASFDVAQLWTDRDFTGAVVGVSPVATLCTDSRYSLTQDYSGNFNSLRALSAHELGHAFGATHDPSNTFYLMRPTILPTLTDFSTASVSQINTHLATRTCLDNYCPFCISATSISFDAATSTLTWQDEAPACSLKIKKQGDANWLLQTTTTAQSYTFWGLSACYAYEAELQPLCNDNTAAYPITYAIAASAAPAGVTVSQPAAGTATINWNSGTNAIVLKIKEYGSTVNLVNTIASGGSYTINGLSPCKSYIAELQTICGGLILSAVTTANINAIQPYVTFATPLSATSAQVGFITYTYASFNYLLRVRQQGSSTWLFETDAQTGVNYTITGLTPCTNYEVATYANCGEGLLGPPRTYNFKTSNLFITNATPQNCNPATGTYELALTINHQQLSGQFSAVVNGNPFVFNYAASPQEVILTNLPALGNTPVAVSVADVNNPLLCSSTYTYTGFKPECTCGVVYSENFAACITPPGWSNSAVGFNTSALWEFGSASGFNNLDGSCMAFFDDDFFDSDGGEAVMLTSPVIDLSNSQEATLGFDYNFNTIDGLFRVRVWNGASWNDVLNISDSDCGFWGCEYTRAEIDITPYLNSNLQVMFIYNDGNGWDWYAGIDNLEICSYQNAGACNAAFYYPGGNTFCKEQSVIHAVIAGNTGGTFSASPPGLLIYPQTGEIHLGLSTAGTYTVTYTAPGLGCQQTAAITITDNCQVRLFTKAFLQGAYTSGSLMNTTLNNLDLLPLTQPYAAAPWNYSGTEGYATAANMPPGMVDWVLLELRSVQTKTVVARKAAILHSDGWVTDVGGNSSTGVLFDGIIPNSHYFVVLRHRNHLSVMSAAPVALPNQGNTYDFTLSVSKAFGNNQMVQTGSKTALYLGDANADGVITRTDYNAYRQQLLQLNAYKNADVNMDGDVTIADFTALQPNVQLIGITELRY